MNTEDKARRDEFIKGALRDFYQANPDLCLEIALKQDEILNPKTTAVYYSNSSLPRTNIDRDSDLDDYEPMRPNYMTLKDLRSRPHRRIYWPLYILVLLGIASVWFFCYMLGEYPNTFGPWYLEVLSGFSLIYMLSMFFTIPNAISKQFNK